MNALTFVLLPLMLAGPFVLIGLTLLAIFRGDPLPLWLLVLLTLGNITLAYFVWTVGPLHRLSALWLAWFLAGAVSEVLLPVVWLLRRWERRGLSPPCSFPAGIKLAAH